MVFSSLVFIMLFLPLVFLGSRFFSLLNQESVNIFLLLASLIFYAWGEPLYVLLMILSITVNYFLGLLMNHYQEIRKMRAGEESDPGLGKRSRSAACTYGSADKVSDCRSGRIDNRKGLAEKLILLFDIVFNLGLLGYYKYYNFLIDCINHLFHLHIESRDIVLPIGISFFTFQILSYMIDLYREKYAAQKNIINLALYISFFPQLIAGPIVRYTDIEQQLQHRVLSLEKTSEGIRRFIYGLGKKVIIANVLAQAADNIFNQPYRYISTPLAWTAALFYTFQIYYDFSGYSDMAIGLGKMMGFDFPENFNYPYLSLSIREFWRRWHISLGSWFREYLYIPLGGNRKGSCRTIINLLLVFLATGLWHGASLNFLIWGLYHGFWQILERFGLEKLLKKFRALAWLYSFFVIMLGWVWFRIEGLNDAWRFTRILFALPAAKDAVQAVSIRVLVSNREMLTLLLAILGAGLLQYCWKVIFSEKIIRNKTNTDRNDLQKENKKNEEKVGIICWLELPFCMLIFLLSVIMLAGNTYNPFIYFRF